MPNYRLYFFHPRAHGIVRIEEIEAASDQAAIELMQAHRGDLALELWQATAKIDAEEATDLASRIIAMRAAAAQEEQPRHQTELVEAA